MPIDGPFRILARFPATATMAAVMGGVYVLQQALGGTPEVAMRLGAAEAGRVMEHHEIYRLFASAWLHHGPVHLALDLLAFVQIGSLVEFVWGALRTFVLFVAASVVAALAAVAFGTWGVPAYGASGGILGLAGLLMVTRWAGEPTLRLFLQEALGRRLSLAVISTFVVGFGLELALPDAISGWGHLGGFVAGAILSTSVREPSAGRELYRLLGVGAALALGASALLVAARGDRALDGYHRRTADVLLTRISADAGSAAAWLDVVAMYDAFVAAGEPELGLRHFREQVGAFDEARWVRGLVGRLYLDQEAGTDRPRALAVALERWLEIRPHDPEVLNAVAWHLVTRTDEAHREPERAVELAEKAIRRIRKEEPGGWAQQGLETLTGSDPSSPRAMRASVLDTLAEALLQAGRVEEALAAQRESVQLATELELSQLPEMQERLDRIEAMRG